ncbi:hypothetical protein HNQ96_001773 [Aminobacter lissarensis]|uniref:Uncharacterized protein n=1 Tax=Aminobacter carboxidus TaxID=376165 RepID=A0A8E1WC04_9HYPH|nr:hypothetical protein [Aminobacter lissarensis]MBB6465915.1 hypothetical protein [Aminobacter lissarensis]
MRPVIAQAAAFGLLAAALPAAAQEFDPATLDLPALVECRTDAPAYTSFALWLAGEPDAASTLGWRAVDSGNPFLSQYELVKPLAAFGMKTSTIVFTSSGPMAVLDGLSAPDLAKKLGIAPMLATPQKFLGEKVVSEKTETSESVTLATRISLNVSTVETHPGKVLAGCSYVLEIK